MLFDCQRENEWKLNIKAYENGEVLLVYCKGGTRDYYLWSVHRQQRLITWDRAAELWEHARESLKRGPDCYGLVQLV